MRTWCGCTRHTSFLPSCPPSGTLRSRTGLSFWTTPECKDSLIQRLQLAVLKVVARRLVPAVLVGLFSLGCTHFPERWADVAKNFTSKGSLGEVPYRN